MASAVVLCIDDQHPVLELRKTQLESVGFSVAIAHNAVEGIRLIKRLPVVAIVIEYKSEGMDARAIAFHVRHTAPNVPIVVISAYFDVAEQAHDWGDSFVLKTTPVLELADIIRRLMSRCRDRKGAAA